MADRNALDHRTNQQQPQVRPQQTLSVQAQFGAFQGPLPPPEMLQRYNEVAPGAADRIIAMAESQMTHRQTLEGAVINGNVAAQRRGQHYAFILGMTAIVGGIGLLAFGKKAEGLGSIITAFTGLAAVFIYGKVEQAKERARKRQELEAAASQPRLPGI